MATVLPPSSASPPPRLHPLDPRRRVDRSQYSAADMPEHPGRVLVVHCLAKGLQWSAAGLLLWPALSLALRRPLRATFAPVFLALPAAGVLATGAMLAFKARAMDDAGVDDRAFRIARHAGQNAVDREAALGAAAGAALGAVLGQRALTGVLAGASLGAALGVAYHGTELEETREALRRVREALK